MTGRRPGSRGLRAAGDEEGVPAKRRAPSKPDGSPLERAALELQLRRLRFLEEDDGDAGEAYRWACGRADDRVRRG